MESILEEEQFLKGLVKGLAAQFGPHCEVVLHDLKNQPYDHTIIAIENGEVTGRKIGDCGTNLGLQVLRGTDREGDKYNYSTSFNGKVLRSTSIYMRDSKGEVIGSLCINLDITDFILAEKAIASMVGDVSKASVGLQEVFSNDVNDLLDTLIQESFRHVGKPVALMNKEDKVEGISYLDKRGALLVKKAGDRISKFYGISKFTLYSYLEETRSDKGVPRP
jgi:predicted transcriptional regulator YheO